MIKISHLRLLIENTLKHYDLYSYDAQELLIGTSIAESSAGFYLRQNVDNFDMKKHALGIYQTEYDTHEYLKEKYRTRFWILKYIDFEELEYNLRYATLLARLKYLSIPQKLPPADDVYAMASYWKQYYNTYKGQGKISDFVRKYNIYGK